MLRRPLATVVFCALILFASRSVAQLVSGTAHGQVQPAVTGTSLLQGKTPANFTSLAGWTLVTKEDFESLSYDCLTGSNSGALAGSHCYCDGAGCNVVIPSASGSHSNGTHALDKIVAGDAANSRFGVQFPITGSETDFYSSYYEWDTGSPVLDADYVFNEFFVHYNSTGCLNGVGFNNCTVFGNQQDAPFDPENFSANYLSSTGSDTFIPQGPHNEVQIGNKEGVTLSSGKWVQHEMWLHPNTCSAGQGIDNHGQPLPAGNGNGDGFYRLYINGVLLNTSTGLLNTTGCPKFLANTIDGTMNMEVGGVSTYLMDSPGTTVTSPCNTHATPGNQVRCGPTFGVCPLTVAAGQPTAGQPCWGQQKSFHRISDDVIFLKK
jgi:hypothetical protein